MKLEMNNKQRIYPGSVSIESIARIKYDFMFYGAVLSYEEADSTGPPIYFG